MTRLVAGVALVLALAGCGSSGHGRAVAPAHRCTNPRAARAIGRLRADVAAIRRAARRPTRDTLKGNNAVNAATDRFLRDVGKAPVDLLVKNRLIDHAAAALSGSCTQCFQALEAERPIPAISHGGRCG